MFSMQPGEMLGQVIAVLMGQQLTISVGWLITKSGL
jgi:hypothetical protein